MQNSSKYIVANWKQHGCQQMLADWLTQVSQAVTQKPSLQHLRLALCAPMPYIAMQHTGVPSVLRGAQYVSPYQGGAYTGEVSARMLQDLAVDIVLVGHSERRQWFNETTSQRRAQLHALWCVGITPVLCIGENAEQHLQGLTEQVLTQQLSEVLDDQPQLGPLILAYEPIFAIGSGHPLLPVEAQQVHNFLRNILARWYTDPLPIPLLYGGSVNPDNVSHYALQPDIDGVLVGGASLNPTTFLQLAQAFIQAPIVRIKTDSGVA